MADFKQAIKWAREGKGKEVRRKSWEGKSIKGYKPDIKEYIFSLEDFEATDWEIYEEKESSGEFLRRLGINGDLWAKEFIKITEKRVTIDIDLMRGWFCNAIEAGRTSAESMGFGGGDNFKEKVQNAHERLKKEMYLTLENANIIDKIFEEVFGDKIIRRSI